MNEKWLSIAGFPDYQVSNMGRVRSRKKSIKFPLPENGWRILKGGKDKDGYRRLVLCTEDNRKSVKIAHLVYEAFIGERSPDKVIRHRNGNNQDDRAENLKQGTQAENINDKFEHGTIARGCSHGKSKLSESQAKQIKSSNLSTTELAKMNGVSLSCVCDIKAGRTWAWL